MHHIHRKAHLASPHTPCMPRRQPFRYREVPGGTDWRCAANYTPPSITHYPPGTEMVAPKLRPDKAQQQRQRQFAMSNEGQLVASGRTQVLELLRDGQNTYTNTPEMKAAVAQMVLENPSTIPAQLINSGAMQGEWQVFHAPHIANMSQYLLNTRFEPIIYRLGENNTIVSNVKFSSVLGSGWLSAAGTIHCVYDASVEIRFERFWVDWGDSLREEIVSQGSQEGTGYIATSVDEIIGSAGRAAFFPQFAVFPIYYLDDDLTVFEFTPLSSKISARRVVNT